MSETFNLDRENNIEANVDALGKKWKIHFNKQNGLCHVRPFPDRVDAVIPKKLRGLWTKPSLLQPLIEEYVIATWDEADAKKAEAERKAQAAKEAERAKSSEVAEAEVKAPAKRRKAKAGNND